MIESSRRSTLSAAAATLLAVRTGFPAGAHAQGAGPETTGAKLGFVALTDAAPLIAAAERGLFAKYGMPDVTVSRQPSWGYVCESLALGGGGEGIDGAHIMTPIAYLYSVGMAQPAKGAVPLQILARLNTNGQAISVAKALVPSGARLDAAPLRAGIIAKPDSRVGITFPGGTHDLWMRYWLAAGGIDPGKDVQTVAVPPPRMVSEMRVSAMEAFCVGEPWGAQAVTQKVGYTACVTGEIWRDHPEKSLAMRADWVARHPRAAVALTAAIIEAQQWAERAENKSELATMLGGRAGLNVPPADIVRRLMGDVDYGDGRTVAGSPVRMKFWADHASYPFQSHDLWFLTELGRWGMLPRAINIRAAIAAVNREDVWRAGATMAGVAASAMPVGTSRGKETFFDGQVFDPADPAAYLAGLKIKKSVA